MQSHDVPPTRAQTAFYWFVIVGATAALVIAALQAVLN